MVFLTSLSGRILWHDANQSWDELVCRPFREFAHVNQRDIVDSYLRDAIATGEPQRFFVEDESGERLWFAEITPARFIFGKSVLVISVRFASDQYTTDDAGDVSEAVPPCLPSCFDHSSEIK